MMWPGSRSMRKDRPSSWRTDKWVPRFGNILPRNLQVLEFFCATWRVWSCVRESGAHRCSCDFCRSLLLHLRGLNHIEPYWSILYVHANEEWTKTSDGHAMILMIPIFGMFHCLAEQIQTGSAFCRSTILFYSLPTHVNHVAATKVCFSCTVDGFGCR